MRYLTDKLCINDIEMPRDEEFEAIYIMKIRGINVTDFCNIVKNKRFKCLNIGDATYTFVSELCGKQLHAEECREDIGRGLRIVYIYTPGNPPDTIEGMLESFSKESMKFLIIDVKRLK